MSQSLWDCGLQVSFVTRPPGECERLDPANPEFALALLDLRWLGGDQDVFARLKEKSVAKLRSRDGKAIGVELAKLTSERHAKFGDTLFHLEPNIKDCPGGLRDANVASGCAACGQERIRKAREARRPPAPAAKSFRKRWRSWRPCAASCTTAMSATTTRWTGRRRMPRRSSVSACRGLGRGSVDRSVLDARLLPPCARD